MFGFSGLTLSYFAINKFKRNLENNLPELVHNPDFEPAKAYPLSFENIHIKLPKNINKGDILVIQNKYGNTNKIYEKSIFKINNADKDLNLEFSTKMTSNTFAYTVYYKPIYEQNWMYLGESNPLNIKNQNINEDEELINVNENNLSKSYDINDFTGSVQINNYIQNSLIQFYISKQYYHRKKRRYLYHSAHEKAIKNPFVSYLSSIIVQDADNLINEEDSKNRLDIIKRIVNFVQGLTYKTDMESLNSYEYIKTPQHTCFNGIGDCEDTVILLNSLIESALGIKTAMIFAPIHVLSAIDSSYLSDEEIYELRKNKGIKRYSTENSTYIPIESTGYTEIGVNNFGNVHSIYSSDGYEIVDASGLKEHGSKLIDKIQ